MATEKELDQDLIEMSTRVERLRVHYQAYFLGMEKRPPLVLRDQLERFIRSTPLNDARKAVHKFRFQTEIQRYRLLEVYWDRIQRALDEGRTTREKLRKDAGYHDKPKQEAPGPGTASPHAPDGGPTDSQQTPQPPAPVKPPPPVDPVMGRLYHEYVTARRSLGLPVEGITPEAFATTLEQQRLVQAHKLGVPSVTFSVVVKEGRVVLMARPVAPSGEVK